MPKWVLIGDCKERISHFLRERLAFWLLAAAVSLSENMGGGLGGKHAAGSGLCAVCAGGDAHLCHGSICFFNFFVLKFAS